MQRIGLRCGVCIYDIVDGMIAGIIVVVKVKFMYRIIIVYVNIFVLCFNNFFDNHGFLRRLFSGRIVIVRFVC